MNRPLIQLVTIAVLCVTVATSGAHDGPLTKEAQNGMTSVIRRVEREWREGRAMTTDDVRRSVLELASVETSEFHHLEKIDGFAGLSEVKQAVVRRSMRAVVLFRALKGNLVRESEIVLGLSSIDPIEFGRAVAVMCAEPFGPGFQKAVVRLAVDERWEIRMAAGLFAKLGTVFEGRCEAYDGVARALLGDRDPRVAAQFALKHCYDFGDPSLVDRMVGLFQDGRALPEGPLGPQYSGARTVGEATIRAFGSSFFLRGRWRHRSQADCRAMLKEPNGVVYEKWWRANRDTWFALPKDKDEWRLVSSESREMTCGKPVTVQAAVQEVALCLEQFSMLEGPWEPTLSMRFSMRETRPEGTIIDDVGMLSGQPLGWIAGAGGNCWVVHALPVPTQGDAVRVHWWLWYGTPSDE